MVLRQKGLIGLKHQSSGSLYAMMLKIPLTSVNLVYQYHSIVFRVFKMIFLVLKRQNI